MITENAKPEDAQALADIRAKAMRESLEAVDRYDSVRVRERFLSGFLPELTHKILVDGQVAGFYMVTEYPDHFFLNHLYILPEFQNRKLGSEALTTVLGIVEKVSKPLRLGALRDSPANDFYLSHGFSKTAEEEFDIYYEFRHGSATPDEI